jgi:hypothetical protein
MKSDEAYNKDDASAYAALYTPGAVEVSGWSLVDVALGQQAVEKKVAVQLASSPTKMGRKLVQVYPIGDEICAILEFDQMFGKKGYCVAICVPELDEWKIQMIYSEMNRRGLACGSSAREARPEAKESKGLRNLFERTVCFLNRIPKPYHRFFTIAQIVPR